MSDWSDDMAARIGKAITKYRGDHPGSWLASETKRLGHPISKTTIWRIETGESKNISVPDLLVIAAALEVPPVALLFPDLPDGVVNALPDIPMSSLDAVRWVSGEGVLPSALGRREDDDHKVRKAERMYISALSDLRLNWHPNAHLLDLSRRYAELWHDMFSRLGDPSSRRGLQREDRQRVIAEIIDEHNAQTKHLEHLIRRAGGNLELGDEDRGEDQ